MQQTIKTRSGRVLVVPSDAEDAAINAAALSDPDNQPLTAEQLTQFKRLRGQRGPQKTATKHQVTLRLDPEVIDFFKAGGKGWQSRINETLLEDIHAKKKTAA